MIQNIKQIKLNYHYLSDLESVYGEKSGYFFTARPLDRRNMIALNFSITRINTIKESVQNLRKTYDAIAPGGVYEEGNTFTIEINLVNLNSPEDFAEILDKVATIFKENGVENICSISDNTDDIGIYRIGTQLHILSETSYRDLTQDMSSQYKRNGGGTGMSYLLALGGLLAGAVIWIILGRMRFVSGIAGFFMLNFAIRGFKRGGGQLLKRDVYVLLALTLVTIIASEIASVALTLMSYNAGASFFEAVVFYVKGLMAGNGLGSFLSQVGIGVALSLWSSWSLIQHLLNFTPTEGKQVRRKNNRLL